MNRRMATIGVFDGVHCGHRDMLAQLRRAAKAANLTPAIVTFTGHPLETVRPEAAPKLLMTSARRLATLSQISDMEMIRLDFDDQLRRLTAREFMTMLRDRYAVDALFMGYDHRFGSDRLTDPEAYEAIADSLGMTIVRGEECSHADATPSISSSAIRRALTSGDVVSARQMLGRPYAIEGTVVAGHQLGRQLGFPTANILPCEPRLLVPAPGVYACRIAMADGSLRGAMVNIGVRPTVEAHGQPTIEAHIFDFDGNIYGSSVELQFIGRLRDEQKFQSLDLLRLQLTADATTARNMLKD